MQTLAFPQIKATPMRESVGEVIRQALYEGRFKAGQSISEAGLAAEMSISRGPVREALLQLAQDGLVVHSPNRGFSVVQLTAKDMEEIQEVRLPLESMALDLARPRMSRTDIAHLEEHKAQIVEAFSTNNLRLSSMSDRNFHTLIWERTGNAHLTSTLNTLLAPYFAYGSLTQLHRRPLLTSELLAEEHDRIIRFLQGRGSDTAEECIRFHLRH